ncbi:MAG: class I SAM-dependent methyltransferase [Thermovirgaceae bacterium]
MFETFMYEFFGALPRQGPGDRDSTRKAFGMVEELPEKPEILDLGCGTGKQTLDLASLTPGRITAVDNYGPFLERLRENVLKSNLSAEVRPVLGEMALLDFPPGSFDLIWCEAAAYIIGFRKALKDWRPFLRKGGSMVISELAWLRKDPPTEAREFWQEEYPGMRYFEDHSEAVKEAGYDLTGYFRLPDHSWWTDFYGPMEEKIASERKDQPSDSNRSEFFDSLETELDMHRKYREYYGYMFFVMRKRG